MTHSHGHRKSRKHKTNGKHAQKVSVQPKQKSKLGYEIEILAAVVAIAIIAVLYFMSSAEVAVQDAREETGGESYTADEVDDSCTGRNPGLSEEECTNYEYKQEAIEKNDPEICDLITIEYMKTNCLRHFGLAR